MGVSQPRSIYGIDSIAFYNRTDGTFYGTPLRVVAGAELNFSTEIIDLIGGSSNWPWATSLGTTTAEINFSLREYPDYLFELLMGATTTVTPITTGLVAAGTNFKGSSVINATTGISAVSATAGDISDLKTGKYVIKCMTATTADVFISSLIDTASDKVTNDLMKIGTIDISSTNAVLADFGLTFTKGSGTIAMVVGDSATFTVANVGSTSVSNIVVGSSSASFPEFGCLIYAQKQGTSEIVEFDFPKVRAAGMPVVCKEKSFSEYSVTAKASYDSVKNLVYTARMIK
jgi:hypothetical protein